MIGGGPAGAAAATTLARTGRSVLLVHDRPAGATWAVGEGAPPGLDRTVDDVFGAGTFVTADHERSYGNRAAWGSPTVTETDFMLNPFGSGWHLDRSAFDARLLAVAQATGVTVCRQRWSTELEAPVVIDASGRRAVHARGNGARLVTEDRLTAVVGVFARAVDDHDSTTTVEAVESGWWYASAIPGRRRVVAFLTDGDLLRPEQRSTAGFAEHLRTTFVVGGLVDGAPELVVVTAAGTTRLDRCVGDGWLAAGDAAASFDPLSSQGILAAVLMGRSAAEQVDGDPESHDARYRVIIERHRLEQRATYAVERRWPDAPFWRRRHGSR